MSVSLVAMMVEVFANLDPPGSFQIAMRQQAKHLTSPLTSWFNSLFQSDPFAGSANN